MEKRVEDFLQETWRDLKNINKIRKMPTPYLKKREKFLIHTYKSKYEKYLRPNEYTIMSDTEKRDYMHMRTKIEDYLKFM